VVRIGGGSSSSGSDDVGCAEIRCERPDHLLLLLLSLLVTNL
jgi:hypothetical protein